MSKTKTTNLLLTWNAVTVGSITDLSIGGNPVTKIDITSFEETLMKYRPGKKELSEVSFGLHVNQDAAVQVSLESDNYNNTERTVTIVCPSGTIDTLTATAKIANFTWGAEGDDVYKAQITLQPTGLFARS